MKNLKLLFVALGLMFVGCQNDTTTDYTPIESSDFNTLTIFTQSTSRTSLGEKADGKYPVYWSEGDKVVVNGIVSEPAVINPQNPAAAQFTINGVLSYPWRILYTGNYSTEYTDCVEIPTEQTYEPNSIKSGYAPMYGYTTKSGESIQLNHLAAILSFPVKAASEGTTLRSITIKTENGEPISGKFTVNYTNGNITATESATTISYSASTPLSTTDACVFNIVIAKGYYNSCTISFIDDNGDSMICKWNASEVKAGVVREFKSITYKAGTTLTLSALGTEYDNFLGLKPCCGYVKDTNGKPLSDVVVSDGLLCTKTDFTGYYELDSDLTNTKFIFASIPSGYKAQNNVNGLPKFYHKVTDVEREAESCVVDFVFESISGDPNRYTIFIGADPQPRAKTKSDDRVAFHSLDMCEDLYRDMRDTRAKITDREVYGMMLGDIVHENMSLFANYVTGVKTIGLQMFNIIGNHDHDLFATTDEEGARRFEENLGPSYYSYNIGKQHFIVLDNVIMTVIDGKLAKNEYTYGLTDKQWQWLQNDLSFVDKSTTLMVASHIPLFKKDSAESEYQNQSAHGTDYASLFASYSKVHAWAGHTHRSFNYNYSSSSSLKNIEVHTLARSTGEFWTNEWNAYGTPRGYTVVEVDGDNISWIFKPTVYQSEFIGNNYSTVGTPTYAHRAFNYNANGIAIMKDSGKELDSSYQMYGWRRSSYVYVQVWMWDDKWEKPKYNGSDMSRVKRTNTMAEDYAYKEMFDFYSENSMLSTYDYDYDPPLNYHNNIFRIKDEASSGSGIITVKDRFGNEFSTTVSW